MMHRTQFNLSISLSQINRELQFLRNELTRLMAEYALCLEDGFIPNTLDRAIDDCQRAIARLEGLNLI